MKDEKSFTGGVYTSNPPQPVAGTERSEGHRDVVGQSFKRVFKEFHRAVGPTATGFVGGNYAK